MPISRNIFFNSGTAGRSAAFHITGNFVITLEPEHTKQRVRDGVYEALKVGTQAVRDEASRRAPVKTGYLENHIEWDGDRESLRFRVFSSTAGSPSNRNGYGGYVEVGTSRTPAQPYLVPALTSKRNEILSLLKGAAQ